jgi:hypothetical protein
VLNRGFCNVKRHRMNVNTKTGGQTHIIQET